MRKLFKAITAMIFYAALIAAMIYVVNIVSSAKDVNGKELLGMKRTIIPFLFVGDIADYLRAQGGFNLLDIFRAIAFVMIAALCLNIPANGLAPKIFEMPPYARDMDIAITKQAKLDEGDVIIKQIAPNKMTIWLSARATLPWTWFRDNELIIEPASGVDVRRWEFYPKSKTVLAYFTVGESAKRAEIWVENGGKLSRIETNYGGSVVYAIGNAATLDDCTVIKAGWAKSIDHIDGREDEANRWDFGNVEPKLVAVIPANGRKDESAVHDLPIFQRAKMKKTNKPGRELFYATKEIKNFFKKAMLQNGNGKIRDEESA